MFGVDKKGNYGPLSLHDYSDDSDDENDFVSEQIRNQRVSQVVGQVRFEKLAGLWPSQSWCRCSRPRCMTSDFDIAKQTPKKGDPRSSRMSVSGSPDCCGEIHVYLLVLGHHRLTAITSDVIVEISYPCMASQNVGSNLSFYCSCFCDDAHQPQQQLKQQDEGLDMLSKSADRLGALSLGISEELGHQNK